MLVKLIIWALFKVVLADQLAPLLIVPSVVKPEMLGGPMFGRWLLRLDSNLFRFPATALRLARRDAGDSLPRQFQLALSIRISTRFLEALAYYAFVMGAGLSVSATQRGPISRSL
jgi:hypothetical protein